VGGLGQGTAIEPGSSSSSGILPAASRSNMLSVLSSSGGRCGAGGSGLLTSEGDEDDDGCAGGRIVPERIDEDDEDGLGTCSCERPWLWVLSVLISLPCRELGGGGFFLEAGGVGG